MVQGYFYSPIRGNLLWRKGLHNDRIQKGNIVNISNKPHNWILVILFNLIIYLYITDVLRSFFILHPEDTFFWSSVLVLVFQPQTEAVCSEY